VLRRVEDLLDLRERCIGHEKYRGSSKAVSDPAKLDVGNGENTWGVVECVAGPVDEVWFDALHEAPSDALDGSPEQHDDRAGNDDADDRVGEREAEYDADGAKNNGEGSEPVEACMDAVCDEGGGANPLADPDPVDGDDLVARETDQAGEVLCPAEPVGVVAGRSAAAKDECDPEGTAVSASEKLWMVSASRATEPLMRKTANRRIVVPSRRKRLIFSARTPWAQASCRGPVCG
jgi:hypothetical protein